MSIGFRATKVCFESEPTASLCVTLAKWCSLSEALGSSSLCCPALVYAHCMSTAASGLNLLLFLQSAMVIFDLAWMMSKDLNDMLWYVVPSQGQCHT